MKKKKDKRLKLTERTFEKPVEKGKPGHNGIFSRIDNDLIGYIDHSNLFAWQHQADDSLT